MITIVIKESENRVIGFEIEGHALSKEYIDSVVGEAYDMICNSISVLSQSTVIGLEEVLGFKTNYKLNDGFLSIDLKGFSEEELEKAQVIMKTFDLSLESIIQGLDKSFGRIKRSQYIKMLKEEV